MATSPRGHRFQALAQVVNFDSQAGQRQSLTGTESVLLDQSSQLGVTVQGRPAHASASGDRREGSPRAPASDAAQPTLWQPALQSNLTLQSDGATAVGQPGSLLLAQERRCAVLGFRRLTHHQRFAAPVFRDCHLQRA